MMLRIKIFFLLCNTMNVLEKAIKKFTDVQAKKMLILRQLQIPLLHLTQSLVLVNALQKIVAVVLA